MSEISVRALCGVGELAAAKLIGGGSGLDREVRSITAVSTLAAAESVAPGTFVIATPGSAGSIVADVLLRAARASGAVAFLVPDGDSVAISTTRLADKLGMPLLLAPVSDPFQLARQLDRAVHAPELDRAEVLDRLVRRLRKDSGTPERILDALAAVLPAPITLFGADGVVLAGEELTLPECLARGKPQATWNGPVRAPGSRQGELVLVPITLTGDTQPTLWLAVDLPPGPRSRTRTAEDAATVAGWALTAWAAGRRLEGERDARERTQLLSAMLEKPGVIDRHLAERVLRVGWRLEGWHTGIYLRAVDPSGPLPQYTELLRAALAGHALSGPLVERALGWAMWLTVAQEPPAMSNRQTVLSLRAALAAIADELPLVAGVGRPCPGARGIVLTLEEAYQASLLGYAGGAGAKIRVAHIDELGLQRLLADWYASESFQTYARQLLEPLRNAGGEPLLRTLETYLEHESNTSTTAAALGVHRNTVSDRIGRAERLLAVDLAASDDRLVVQLACRTYRLGAVGARRDAHQVASQTESS